MRRRFTCCRPSTVRLSAAWRRPPLAISSTRPPAGVRSRCQRGEQHETTNTADHRCRRDDARDANDAVPGQRRGAEARQRPLCPAGQIAAARSQGQRATRLHRRSRRLHARETRARSQRHRAGSGVLRKTQRQDRPASHRAVQSLAWRRLQDRQDRIHRRARIPGQSALCGIPHFAGLQRAVLRCVDFRRTRNPDRARDVQGHAVARPGAVGNDGLRRAQGRGLSCHAARMSTRNDWAPWECRWAVPPRSGWVRWILA